MNKKLLVVMVLVCLLGGVQAVSKAQDGGNVITYGSTEFGTLSTASPVEQWQFDGLAGDVATIEMRAAGGGVDAYLMLRAPDGRLLGMDDNSGSVYPDAALRSVGLPVSGTYTIFAQSAYQTLGDYELALTREQTGMVYGTMSTGGVLEFDKPTVGGVSEEVPINTWTFSGVPGDVISVEVQAMSSALIPCIILRNPDSDVVQIANQNGYESTARLDNVTLSWSGEYTLIIQRTLGNSASGDYQISLTRTQQGITSAAGGGALKYGEPVVGALWSQNTSDEWTFDAVLGEVVTVDALSSNTSLYPTLDIFGPAGDLVAANDYYGYSSQSTLADFLILETGTYRVLVGSSSGTWGDYTLTVTRTQTGITEYRGGGSLLVGERGVSTITPGDAVDNWSFEGQEGAEVTIQMQTTTGNLIPMLALSRPDGVLMTSQDSYYYSYDSTTPAVIGPFTLPVSGTYEIIAQASLYDLSTFGNYGIIVIPSDSRTTSGGGGILIGETVVGNITSADPGDLYHFEVTVPTRVAVAVTRGEGNLNPFVEVVNEAGKSIASDDDSAGAFNAAINEVRLEPGKYTLTVRRPDKDTMTEGTYTLTITPLD